jgi:Putative methyltransferase
VDWRAWHDAYEEPDSGLGQRLVLVQEQVRAALDRMPPGPVKAVSVCAGQGHDLIGTLAGHERRGDVSARLVELDAHNVLLARRAAQEAGLDGVQVVAGDASLTDAYEGAVPADVVLVCGVFGNISAEDIQRTIASLSQLCAENATVIWTRHRLPPDITPTIRRWFADRGFEELAFEVDQSGRFAVGAQRLTSAPVNLCEGDRLFSFVGFWDKALDG